MNPFDLRGPEFLLLYSVVGAATLLALIWARRQSESGTGHLRLTDPYLIACLRGGPNEALRVATVALVDRGLLTADGSTLVANPDQAGLVRHPVEQALLDKFAGPGEAASVFSDPSLLAAAGELERTLETHRLLPDRSVRRARVARALAAVGFLWALALIKVMVALSRGRRNVAFLIVLAVVLALATVLVSMPRRTLAGDEVMDDLRTLFGGLKERRLALSPHQADEVALLAGVYGIGMLPHGDWGYARKLYPRANGAAANCGAGCGAASTSSWSSSSSCGSSGSSGSSCGSSCGGGCGGGCGGCGG